jgi:nitroreductase
MNDSLATAAQGVIEAIHARRSIRVYRADPVDRGLIEDLLWAAAQAPTPPVSGASAWAFCVVDGVERLAAYGERAKRYARDHRTPGDTSGWPDRPGFKVFWDAPVLALICARRGNPEAPFDCCRAGQNLLLAAHAAGLGACWVGAPLPWLHSAGVAAELGLPSGFDASVAVILGHPAETPPGEPRPRPVIHWCGS